MTSNNEKNTSVQQHRVAVLTAKFIDKSISTREHDELDELIGNNDDCYTLFEKLIVIRDIKELNSTLQELGVDRRVKSLKYLKDL